MPIPYAVTMELKLGPSVRSLWRTTSRTGLGGNSCPSAMNHGELWVRGEVECHVRKPRDQDSCQAFSPRNLTRTRLLGEAALPALGQAKQTSFGNSGEYGSVMQYRVDSRLWSVMVLCECSAMILRPTNKILQQSKDSLVGHHRSQRKWIFYFNKTFRCRFDFSAHHSPMRREKKTVTTREKKRQEPPRYAIFFGLFSNRQSLAISQH